MVDKNKVEEVINLIRPALQADGGDITLVGVDDDGTVNVELTGACAGCPFSQLTLSNSVERILKDRVEGVERVVPAM
jgi:Fe-S cluster biogenesis protein NfuA